MRIIVLGCYNFEVGNGKGCDVGLVGIIFMSYCGNIVFGCCWEGWVVNEFIC